MTTDFQFGFETKEPTVGFDQCGPKPVRRLHVLEAQGPQPVHRSAG